MGKRVSAILLLCGVALVVPLRWFYDNLAFDAVIGLLAKHGVPEARLIASAPPIFLAAAIAYGMFRWLRFELERQYAFAAQPDMKVSSAIDYIVNDSVAILEKPKRPVLSGAYPPGTVITISGVEHQDARKRLNAKLISGEVHSWGLRQIKTHIPNSFEHSPREIPKEYWDDMQLDFQSCLYYRGPYSQTMKIPGRQQTYNWADVQVSREQIKRLWPKKSFLKRMVAIITKKPRLDYAKRFDMTAVEQEAARPQNEWKPVSAAIETFADQALIKVRDEATVRKENTYTKAKKAESRIRELHNKFPGGHVPENAVEAQEMETERESLRIFSFANDSANNDLRFVRDDLRADIYSRLCNGELLAKGFRMPHVAGNVDVEIAAQEWKILDLDDVNSEALRMNSPEVVYSAIAIRKA